MNKIYAVYGASGFGQEVSYWLKRKLAESGDSSEFFYIDDQKGGDVLDGNEVITFDQFESMPGAEKFCAIAIAAVLGEGSFISAFVDITSNIKIGLCFHANTYSYVGHDCIIGDFVTFAPKVSCNGNVHIHDHVYIGTGAILKQGTPEKPLVIGKGAVIGMGAVVTKDVPPGVTVIGNPAKPLEKK
jgi:acetyltransferase-like isoleucine patch superfamily enzyme